MLPPLVYRRLNQSLDEAKLAFSRGDFDAARSTMNKARAICSRLQRRNTRLESANVSDMRWAEQQHLGSETTEVSLELMQNINDSLGSIAEWLDTFINSIGVEELIKHREGIDILIERRLSNSWDYKHDIVVVTGKQAQQFVEPLASRGQRAIIVVHDADTKHMEVITRVPPKSRESDGGSNTVVLHTDKTGQLSDEQLAALQSSVLPHFIHIPSGLNESPFEGFEDLIKQIEKEFVLQAGQKTLPIIFTSQWLRNLPMIKDFRSVEDLRFVLTEQPVMIAAPGPSLLDSLSSILAHRESFVLVAMVRALPPLMDFGIIPDFAILSDAGDHTGDNLNLIPKDRDLSQISLIASEYACRTTFESQFKDFILMPMVELLGSPLSKAMHGDNPPRIVGTGVASFAVSLFSEIGVRSITLIGQDLSISGKTYAASDQSPRRKNFGKLVCRGISGDELPTQDDYLQFISELEFLASKYSGEIEMYNCTAHGAFIDHWTHIPLSANHPEVLRQQNGRLKLSFEASSSRLNPKSSLANRQIADAIDEEICQVVDVETSCQALVGELTRLLQDGSAEFTDLQLLEKKLQTKMGTNGSLVSFYTLPVKLETDAALDSVQSLEDNLLVSLDYYVSVQAHARHLSNVLHSTKSYFD